MIDITKMNENEFEDHKRRFYAKQIPTYNDLTQEERDQLQKSIKSKQFIRMTPDESHEYIQSIIKSRLK